MRRQHVTGDTTNGLRENDHWKETILALHVLHTLSEAGVGNSEMDTTGWTLW